jgi:hypothetical protein
MLHKEKGKSTVIDKEVYKVTDSSLWRQIDPAYRPVSSYCHLDGFASPLPSSQEASDYFGEVQPKSRFFTEEVGGESPGVLYEGVQPLLQFQENAIIIRTTWNPTISFYSHTINRRFYPYRSQIGRRGGAALRGLRQTCYLPWRTETFDRRSVALETLVD